MRLKSWLNVSRKVGRGSLLKKQQLEDVLSVFFAKTQIIRVNSKIPAKNGGWTRIESEAQMVSLTSNIYSANDLVQLQ